MKKVMMYRTSDGEVHDDQQRAWHHVDLMILSH